MRQSVPVSNWTNLELCCKKLTFEEKKYADDTFGFNLMCSLKLHSNILFPERILKTSTLLVLTPCLFFICPVFIMQSQQMS